MFSNLFHPDSKFVQIGTKACDLIIVSILWLGCSLPLFTLGPSCTAMYYVIIHDIRGKDGSGVMKDFFRVFKRDFRQSLGVMLIYTLLAAVTLLSIHLCTVSGMNDTMVSWLLRAVLAVLLMMMPYGFSYIARFENTFSNVLTLTAFFTFRHLLFSLAAVVILVAGALLVFFHLPTALFIPGLVTLGISFPVEHVFGMYTDETTEDTAE